MRNSIEERVVEKDPIKPTRRNFVAALLLSSASIVAWGSAGSGETTKRKPFVVQDQGSFAVGGKVVNNPAHLILTSRLQQVRRSTVTMPMCFIRYR